MPNTNDSTGQNRRPLKCAGRGRGVGGGGWVGGEGSIFSINTGLIVNNSCHPSLSRSLGS